MPNGIPRVRGPAIAREISQIGAPESPARRGGAGVLEALRETFALSPAAREIKIKSIAAERERRVPAGAGEAAAIGLLFQSALVSQGVPVAQAIQQAQEKTVGLTRGQLDTVRGTLGLILRQNPQGADRALNRSLTLRGQLAQQVSRLDDDIRALEQIGIAGEPFTTEQKARRDQLVKERGELKTSLDAFDRLINGLFGIGGAQPEPAPVGGRVQTGQPARRGEPPPQPAPADVTGVEQEFLGGL